MTENDIADEFTLWSADSDDYHDPARIYPLIDDDANRELLVDWLASADDYEPVTAESLEEASFDLCLVDRPAIDRHFDALQRRKRREEPVLLPYLYLVPDASSDFLESEYAHLGEALVQSTLDEVLAMPVRQAELAWRIDSLLRMRAQTLRLADRDRALRRLSRAVEAAGQAIYVTDTEGTITYVNPAFEEMTGYAPEEAIGETPHILFSGEMDEAYYESLWETIQAGEVWEEEIVDERKDGELYHALQTIAPVPDDDGTVERFVAIQTDITEQKFLERRRRQYQQAIENSVELIAAVDDDENYLFANETYREYHDLGETAVQGQSLAEVLGAEEYAAVRPHVEAVRNGETVRRETTRIHPTLGRRVLDVLYYPLRDDEGAIQGIIASMRDVTDHKEESRQLETLIGHLPGIVYRCHNTPDWPMTFVGGQCEAITGYSAEQLESDALSWGDDIVHPDARERVFDEVQAAVARDEPFEVTYRIRTADGETRWVWEQGQRVKPYTGDESMLEGIIMDVTERKAQETEIRQKSRTIDEAPIGIVITDPTLEDNPMTYVNDEFAAMTGYDRSAALGRNCRFLQGENTDPDTVARIRRSIDAEEPVSAVLRNYRADGTEFWNNLEIAPVRDDDGEVINYIGFQQDITERIERQRQLRKIDRVLRHNLNNDLNVVQGMAELIRSEVGSPLVEYADRIIETSDSLLETMDKERRITSLLSEEPQPTTVALLPTLETVVERYREAYPAATVELNAPEDVTVRATTQLETALAELLDNALEHNDSDAPTAAVSVTTGPDAVTVEISDDGPGIPEMEAAIVTDGEVETPLSHGKGMGLWLVQLIVRRSGGTLEFVDGETAGSTVAITLARAGS